MIVTYLPTPLGRIGQIIRVIDLQDGESIKVRYREGEPFRIWQLRGDKLWRLVPDVYWGAWKCFDTIKQCVHRGDMFLYREGVVLDESDVLTKPR